MQTSRPRSQNAIGPHAASGSQREIQSVVRSSSNTTIFPLANNSIYYGVHTPHGGH